MAGSKILTLASTPKVPDDISFSVAETSTEIGQTSLYEHLVSLIHEDKLNEFKLYGKVIAPEYYVYMKVALRDNLKHFVEYLQTLETGEGAIPGYQLLSEIDDILDSTEWDTLLKWLDSNYEQLLASVIGYNFSIDASTAVDRLMELYPFTDLLTEDGQELLIDYYNLALDMANVEAMEAIGSYIVSMPEAPIPPWVVSASEGKSDPLDTSGYVNHEDVDFSTVVLAALALSNKILKAPLDKVSVQKLFLESAGILLEFPPYLSDETPFKQLSMINNPQLKKIAGPVNFDVGLWQSADDECTRLGGCRMLVCQHHFDEDDGPADWFLGYCEICSKAMKQRTRAIREPLDGGGYIGCYHSATCCRIGIHQRYQLKSEIEAAEACLNTLLQDLGDTGIVDRPENIVTSDVGSLVTGPVGPI